MYKNLKNICECTIFPTVPQFILIFITHTVTAVEFIDVIQGRCLNIKFYFSEMHVIVRVFVHTIVLYVYL